jgi:hypothetical protein
MVLCSMLRQLLIHCDPESVYRVDFNDSVSIGKGKIDPVLN